MWCSKWDKRLRNWVGKGGAMEDIVGGWLIDVQDQAFPTELANRKGAFHFLQNK